MLDQHSATVLHSAVSANTTKLPAGQEFSVVPGHPYRVSIQTKGWSPAAAVAARKTMGGGSDTTFYDYATMYVELRDPPPNTGPVLIFGGGVKLTQEDQTVTWSFSGPNAPAGTHVKMMFAYSNNTSGVEYTHVNAVTIFGTVAASD